MALALIETPLQEAVRYSKSGTGEYKVRVTLPISVDMAKVFKEAFIGGPKAFRSDAELKGTGKQPPAKYPDYLPTWDGEKK